MARNFPHAGMMSTHNSHAPGGFDERSPVSGRGLCLCCLIAGSSASWAQESHLDTPGEIPKYVRDPIPLYTTGLGPFHRPISSKNKEAQAFFDQGFQMMYAFAKPRGGALVPRSVEARSGLRDLLLGRRLGVGLVPERPDDRRAVAVRLRGDAEGGQPASDKATPKERAFIDALAVRYVKNFDADEARASRTRPTPTRWARSPRSIPTISTPITLYADALFLLEPRRGTRDVNAPERQAPAQRARIGAREGQQASRRLPSLRARHRIDREARARPKPAPSSSARRIPGASHINHMPSHTWNEVGRWGDSVRGQPRGVALGSEGRRRRRLRDLSRSQPAHAALRRVDGRPGRDRDAGRQGLRQADQRRDVSGADAGALRPLRRGLEVTKRPEREIPAAAFDFAQGYAQAEAGRAGLREGLSREGAEGRRHVEGRVPQPPARSGCVGVLAGILDGEITRMAGDLPGAIATFEAAVKLDDEMDYDEPEPLPVPGAPLARRGAARSQALRRRREGLSRRARSTIRTTAGRCSDCSRRSRRRARRIAAVDADLAKSWSRSDTWIRASRF